MEDMASASSAGAVGRRYKVPVPSCRSYGCSGDGVERNILDIFRARLFPEMKDISGLKLRTRDEFVTSTIGMCDFP